MLHALFSTLPTSVCLCWFVIFALCHKTADRAKRILTLFLLVCTVLYLCHAYLFNEGEQAWMEGLWMLCSLSVYPLYFIYIKQLTSSESSLNSSLWYLIPALMVAGCNWMGFIELSQWTHKAVFMVQVILICWMGVRRLNRFDRQLKEAYADTEDTTTEPLRTLLICFVVTSVISSVFNAIGRQFFATSVWLLAIPSILFSSMLFAVSYVGYSRKYVALQLHKDIEEEVEQEQKNGSEPATSDKFGPILKRMMEEQQLYLKPDIKINELALQVGTCRTYLSAYLNQELGVSFSDYINRQRIEYAKGLMAQSPDLSIAEVATSSGFASVTSFVRNYKKFLGKAPNKLQL